MFFVIPERFYRRYGFTQHFLNPFGYQPGINIRRKIPAGERNPNHLLKGGPLLHCIFFSLTDKPDKRIHTDFRKKAPWPEQICGPENPPTPHGNPTRRSLMAAPINGVSPSLQNDGIIRHPAIAFVHEGKAASRFTNPAFTEKQNTETANPNEYAVDHNLPLTSLPKQAGQPAVEQ